MFKQYMATIGGARLMMSNARMSDPVDRYTKALKALTGQKKKSDDDHAEISRIEFEGRLYFHEKHGPYLPDQVLNAVLVEGARKRKQGTVFSANISVAEEYNRLEYDGPRTVEAMWEAGKFADRRPVVVGQAKTMRTRPMFRDWRVTFTVQVLECELNGDDIESALLNAGPYGIGDGRPMLAGKFTLLNFKEISA